MASGGCQSVEADIREGYADQVHGGVGREYEADEADEGWGLREGESEEEPIDIGRGQCSVVGAVKSCLALDQSWSQQAVSAEDGDGCGPVRPGNGTVAELGPVQNEDDCGDVGERDDEAQEEGAETG